MKNFKKIISMLLVFSLLLLLSACGTCNKSNEKDQQNIHTPEDTVEITEAELTDTENGTDKPTEKPTEKATEPQNTDIVIDGIKFDEALKYRLKNAKTYGEVCEILGKEGTLIEAPECVTYWNCTRVASDTELPECYVFIKFKLTEQGVVVSEDYVDTTATFSHTRLMIDESIKDDIVVGKSLEEIKSITGIEHPQFIMGGMYKYEWRFEENISISIYLHNQTVFDTISDMEELYNAHFCNIELWDNETAEKNMAESYFYQIKLGQSMSDVRNLIGKIHSILDTNAYVWKFDDGTAISLGYYARPYEPGTPTDDFCMFNGTCRILRY